MGLLDEVNGTGWGYRNLQVAHLYLVRPDSIESISHACPVIENLGSGITANRLGALIQGYKAILRDTELIVDTRDTGAAMRYINLDGRLKLEATPKIAYFNGRHLSELYTWGWEHPTLVKDDEPTQKLISAAVAALQAGLNVEEVHLWTRVPIDI